MLVSAVFLLALTGDARAVDRDVLELSNDLRDLRNSLSGSLAKTIEREGTAARDGEELNVDLHDLEATLADGGPRAATRDKQELNADLRDLEAKMTDGRWASGVDVQWPTTPAPVAHLRPPGGQGSSSLLDAAGAVVKRAARGLQALVGAPDSAGPARRRPPRRFRQAPDPHYEWQWTTYRPPAAPGQFTSSSSPLPPTVTTAAPASLHANATPVNGDWDSIDFEGLDDLDGEDAAWLDDTVTSSTPALRDRNRSSHTNVFAANASARTGELQDTRTTSLLQASGSLRWLFAGGGTAAPTTAESPTSTFGPYAPGLPPRQAPTDSPKPPEDGLLNQPGPASLVHETERGPRDRPVPPDLEDVLLAGAMLQEGERNKPEPARAAHADLEEVLLAAAMLQERERSAAQTSPAPPEDGGDGREELKRHETELQHTFEDVQQELRGLHEELGQQVRNLHDSDREVGVRQKSILSIHGGAELLRKVTKAKTDLLTAEDLLHRTDEALRRS